MKKILKIRFVKLKNALAMQVLEMEGKFSDSKHVKIGNTRFCYDSCTIAPYFYIAKDNLVGVGYFGKNEQRDEYLNNVVKRISEEQFSMTGKIKIGEMCAVSNNTVNWSKRVLLAVLPVDINKRYITNGTWPHESDEWKYARPISESDNLIIEEDDIYTWQMEVAE